MEFYNKSVAGAVQQHAEEGRKASVAADIPVCLENSKSVCHYQYHDEIINTNL